MNHEYAVTPADVLARRTRLAFLNSTAARLCLPRVVEIMAEAWQEVPVSLSVATIHDGCLCLGLGVANCLSTNVISYIGRNGWMRGRMEQWMGGWMVARKGTMNRWMD